MKGLAFEPYIPLALWLPLALAAMGLLITYALASRTRLSGRVRQGILALMTVALALPLLILLNPTWIEPIPPPEGKPRLTILVDHSASMAIPDGDNGSTRYQQACLIAGETMYALKDRFEVRVGSVAETTAWRGIQELDRQQPDGMSTDLGAGIEQSLDDRPQGQALLLLSDGVHNASGGVGALRQSVARAHAMAAPIYVNTIGTGSGVQDLQVSLRLPQEMAFPGQTVPVSVTIHQRGALVDRVQLSLQLDDQEVERQDVRVAPDGTTDTTLQVVQHESGLYRYQVRLQPHAGEVTDVNNNATLSLRVVDEPVRVLLLEGKPYWDTKFLVRTLAADASVDLTTLIRLAEGRYLQRHITREDADDGTGSTPDGSGELRGERWSIHRDLDDLLSGPQGFATYQIVLLGRDAEAFLSDARTSQLKKWLAEDNGSLVCFRGSPATQVSQQLAELMPVRWTPARESRFRVKLTDTGRSAQWLPVQEGGQDMLAQLPTLATVAQPQQPKPLTVVLATADDPTNSAPVISYQPVGNGRVVVVEGAGMWRWAFLPPEHQQFDETYGMLWRSLIRWLVANSGLLPSQQVAMRSDKVTFNSNEPATATLLTRNIAGGDAPRVELTGTGLAAPQTISPVAAGTWPGQFRVVFGQLPEGQYRATVVGANNDSSAVAVFDVRHNLTERLDVAARSDLLEMIAKESGGAVLERGQPEQLVEKFDEYLSASRPQRSVKIIAWDRWWVLLTVYGIWAAAWGLRRRNGLV